MKNNHKFLTFDEQIQKFKERGMKFKDENKALHTLNFINYYKIKEFSLNFLTKNDIYFEDVYFEDIVDRFYWDKNLRLYVLRITEKIEIFLKTQISYILSRDYGALGYLEFKNWNDKNLFCKYYTKHKEKEFKNKLKNYIINNNKILIQNIKLEHFEELSIWLAFDLLTLGDIIDLYLLLDIKYKKEISNFLKLKPKEFESWLKNIKLTRNLSAHNSNIIDISFKTKPKISPYIINGRIHNFNNSSNPNNKIALTIIILEYLAFSINPNFSGSDIKKALKHFCCNPNIDINKADFDAQKLGFKNYQVIEKIKI